MCMILLTHQQSPCSSPHVWESSAVTRKAELLVIYADKRAWGLVLQEPYSFKLLWHWCLVRCSPKNWKDRQSNLRALLHAVQLSWNPNSIYSYFMSQLKSDKCYPLQTLSWTKYTQCRCSAENRAQFCEILTGISTLLLAPDIFQQIKFFVLLYVVFGRLAVCSVIWLWVTQISSLRMWLFSDQFHQSQ